VLKKKLLTLSTAALMMGGLVGCGADDNNFQTQNDDDARPLGYYSNENNSRNLTNENRNRYRINDNDGPLTEIMDRTGNDEDNNTRNRNNNTTLRNRDDNRTGVNRNRQDRGFGTLGNDRNNRNNTHYGTTNNNDQNRTGIQGTNNRNRGGIFGIGNDRNNGGTLGTLDDNRNNNGIFGNDNNRGTNGASINNVDQNRNGARNNTQGANRQSTADRNYHGHINDANVGNDRAKSSAFYNNYNGDLANKIVQRAEKIKNVDDAHAVVMGDNIVIAIDTNDKNDRDVNNQVRNAVESLTKGKDVRVVSDEATYSRVRDLDNNIRNGRTTDTINADFEDLFENIGETIRRPFQTNNR